MSKLNSKSLYIEKISTKHIDQGWLNWINDADNLKVLVTVINKYSRKDLLKYIKKVQKKKDQMFAVKIRENNEYIGNIKINDIDYYNKRCSYGLLLGNKKYKRKGYGLIMFYKICEYAFEKLKMNKIFSVVFTDNYESLSSHLKFGMRISGHFKNHFKMNNQFKDVYFFELTKDNFKKIKKKFN